MFDSVLVANRGEIAVRVIRTLKALGIRSVAIFTEPDRGALHTRVADEALLLGGPMAYLDVDAVIGAAKRAGAAALHPGYGFLSENPALAEACDAAGIEFVGPGADAIRAMGDKINAKRLVSSAGVPVVPGCDDRDLDDEGLAEAAREVGLPVLLKPSAGGGGKGMRRVDDPGDLLASIAAARREATAAFGDPTLLVERFVSRPRHVEIQVVADRQGNVVALGERECSLQRRHQKIVEEAPSPFLPAGTRERMETAAVAAARSCGYVGAGTVEFIVSGDRPDEFFFMEMNTRLQVEHPVTEMTRGVDLVELQLRIASGEALPWTAQASVPKASGHAVEARVYSEDPVSGFLPATGTVRQLQQPAGAEGIRVDSCLFEGLEIGTGYDPMLAKVIAWGADRPEALRRLSGALSGMAVVGVTTNVGFLRRLLEVEAVRRGDLDTELVERAIPQTVPGADPGPVAARAAAIRDHLHGASGQGPWGLLDGWRLSGRAARVSRWRSSGEEITVELLGSPGGPLELRWDGGEPVQALVTADGGTATIEVDGSTEQWRFAADGDRMWLWHLGDHWEIELARDAAGGSDQAAGASGPVLSPMPGTVLAVHVSAGDTVRAGEALVTVEAMKMEHVVASRVDGKVARVMVGAGQSVALGDALAEVDADSGGEAT